MSTLEFYKLPGIGLFSIAPLKDGEDMWKRISWESCRMQLGIHGRNEIYSHSGTPEDPGIYMDHDLLVRSQSPPQVEAIVGTEQPTRWRGAGPGRSIVEEEP